jgi:uncharacterized protein YabN with tetrapyrrole methylase and pyrophosphatase domain
MAYFRVEVSVHGVVGGTPAENILRRILQAIDKEFPTLMKHDIQLELIESTGFDKTNLEHIIKKVEQEEAERRMKDAFNEEST